MGLIERIGIVDMLDIALVSMLIYGVYSLFRRTRAAHVLVGIAAVGILYLVARYINLGLTVEILQAFFAVIIIALIVIFQDEVRRLFERIGGNRWFGKVRSKDQGALSVVERRIQVLVDTVSDLASQSIGALIVIEKASDVLSFITGGITLNGQISESIMKSIFDPHSQGHDGAIIISGDTITRFACHLPLSTSTVPAADFGTRHAAGLGIAERTDALCIIVSEERGTVSVASEGSITVLDQPAALAATLRDFYVPTAPDRRSRWTENLIPKLLSIVIAIILWILVVLIPAGE